MTLNVYNVYRINEYDMIIEDRVKGIVRFIMFDRNDTLKPTTWLVKYGKRFIDDMVMMILYRTNEQFKNDFINYCKEYNVFQEIITAIESESEVTNSG